MKLPTSIKQQWLEALRSGKYEQNTGRLECDGKYCCLGVLQKVLDGDVERYHNDMAQSLPTTSWCEKHELADQFRKDYSAEIDLAYLNDNFEYSFEQIADVIENNM